MLVDLIVSGKGVAAVAGGGGEAELKVLKLLDSGADVDLVSDGADLTPRLRRLAASKKIRLIRPRPSGGLWEAFEEELAARRPRLVFVVTGDPRLDEKMAEAARSRGALVCVVDTPALNDFNMPAVAKVGDIRVAISTGGMSPAMASVIRKRVERLITRRDVLQVRLQAYLRRATKKRLADPAQRRSFVYRVIDDDKIGELLRRNRYEEARRLAMRILMEEAA